MSRQPLRQRSGQAKSPSLAQDLLALGDIYLTLVWLAVKRFRYGSRWPWDAPPRRRGSVLTLVRPEKAEDEREPAAAKRA